ncbi:hypothetical protein ACVILE_005527 [Streptomyces sp. M18.1]
MAGGVRRGRYGSGLPGVSGARRGCRGRPLGARGLVRALRLRGCRRVRRLRGVSGRRSRRYRGGALVRARVVCGR